VHQPNFEVLEI